MMLRRKLVFTSGLKDFEMLEKLLKMMRVVKDQQPKKTMKKIDFVRNLVKKDGRLTVYQIAETVGISVDLAHSILHDDLCLGKLSARWVPKRCAQISSISEVNCQRRFCSKLKQMKTDFLIELLQEMKHGSTSMILKQNSTPNSGSHVDHLTQSNSSLRGL